MLEAVIGLLPEFAANVGGTCILGLGGSVHRPFPLSWPLAGAFTRNVFAQDCSQAVLFPLLLPTAVAAP